MKINTEQKLTPTCRLYTQT